MAPLAGVADLMRQAPRCQVDDRFVNEITRDQHLVIYGSSKQGKRSLLEDDAERRRSGRHIQCALDWDKEAMYRAILKEIGISLAETETHTRTGTGR